MNKRIKATIALLVIISIIMPFIPFKAIAFNAEDRPYYAEIRLGGVTDIDNDNHQIECGNGEVHYATITVEDENVILEENEGNYFLYTQESNLNLEFLKETCVDFIKLLAPFAPHFSEEQWSLLGNTSTVFNEKWPIFDANALVKDEVEIAIQVNGKIKTRINIPSGLNEENIKEAALNDEHIKAATEGKNIVKVIVIKGRLVNIVVK